MLLEELEQFRRRTDRSLASQFSPAECKIQLDPVKKTDGEVFRLLDEKPQIVAGIRLRSVETEIQRNFRSLLPPSNARVAGCVGSALPRVFGDRTLQRFPLEPSFR